MHRAVACYHLEESDVEVRRTTCFTAWERDPVHPDQELQPQPGPPPEVEPTDYDLTQPAPSGRRPRRSTLAWGKRGGGGLLGVVIGCCLACAMWAPRPHTSPGGGAAGPRRAPNGRGKWLQAILGTAWADAGPTVPATPVWDWEDQRLSALLTAHAETTNKQYALGWRKWTLFCKLRPLLTPSFPGKGGTPPSSWRRVSSWTSQSGSGSPVWRTERSNRLCTRCDIGTSSSGTRTRW